MQGAICRYWFDGDLNTLNTVDCENGELLSLKLRVPELNIGYHSVTIQYCNGEMQWSAPITSFFIQNYKKTDVRIIASTSDGKYNSETAASSAQTECTVSLKDFPSGMRTMNFSIFDASGNQMLTTSSIVDIVPNGGNGIKFIDFFVEDNENPIKYSGYLGSYPSKINEQINLQNCEYKPSDEELTMEGTTPLVYPVPHLKIYAFDAYGHMTDTIVQFKDAFRQRELKAPTLANKKQFDFEKSFTSPYWVTFEAPQGDMSLQVRRPCEVTLYSPNAIKTELSNFETINAKKNFQLGSEGKYYVKVREIKESSQIFSMKVSHRGEDTSEDPGNGDKEDQAIGDYPGNLVRWDSNKVWNSDTFTDGKVIISQNNPKFDAENNIVMKEGDNFKLHSSKNIIKAYLVPAYPDKTMGYYLGCNHGMVYNDSIDGVFIWDGYDKEIEFQVFAQQNNENFTPVKYRLRKIYLTYEDEGQELITDIEAEQNKWFDGTTYSHMYLWKTDGDYETFALSKISWVNFEDNSMHIMTDGTEIEYSLTECYVITYENNPYSASVESFSQANPCVEIRDGKIMFNNLPASILIVDTNGIVYFSQEVKDEDFEIPLDTFMPGIYLIKVGERSSKIIIK